MDGGSSFFQNFKTRYISRIKTRFISVICQINSAPLWNFHLWPPGLPSDISSDPRRGAGGGVWTFSATTQCRYCLYKLSRVDSENTWGDLYLFKNRSTLLLINRQILQAKSKRSHVYTPFHWKQPQASKITYTLPP